VDPQGRIIVSGNYTGSMEVDDHFLVTPKSESSKAVDSFVSSFGGPPFGDRTPPDVGHTTDDTGTIILTTPRDKTLPATGPSGTNVFFMPPTAIDAANSGASVTCVPPPNTTFPIAKTPVTCTASDPSGNKATVSFNVTVVDTFGPVFPPVDDLPVSA